MHKETIPLTLSLQAHTALGKFYPFTYLIIKLKFVYAVLVL